MSDADSSVYLFGSVHALPPGVEWQTPALADTIAAANRVYFEADVGVFAQVWAVYAMFSTGMNFDRSRWTERLDDDEYIAVAEALSTIGMAIEDAEVYEPWVIAMMLEGSDLSGSDLSMASGVEATIQRGLAPDRVSYFETASQQLRIFSSGSEAEQLDMLVAWSVRAESEAGQLDDIIAAWANGDEPTLERVFLADLGDTHAPFLDRILFERNRNWVVSIERMLDGNEQDLVVVGAAHLIGDEGVVALLRDAGYAVKRGQ